MSNATHHGTSTDGAGGHGDELPCEPDDVPVRFLVIVAAVVTAIALGLVFIGYQVFELEAARQLALKGHVGAQQVETK